MLIFDVKTVNKETTLTAILASISVLALLAIVAKLAPPFIIPCTPTGLPDEDIASDWVHRNGIWSVRHMQTRIDKRDIFWVRSF